MDNHAIIIDRSGAGVVRLMRAVSSGHGNGIRGRVEQRTKVEDKEELIIPGIELSTIPSLS